MSKLPSKASNHFPHWQLDFLNTMKCFTTDKEGGTWKFDELACAAPDFEKFYARSERVKDGLLPVIRVGGEEAFVHSVMLFNGKVWDCTLRRWEELPLSYVQKIAKDLNIPLHA